MPPQGIYLQPTTETSPVPDLASGWIMKGRPHPLETSCRDVSHLLGRHPDLVDCLPCSHRHKRAHTASSHLILLHKTNFIEKEVAEGVKHLDLGICSFLPGY